MRERKKAEKRAAIHPREAVTPVSVNQWHFAHTLLVLFLQNLLRTLLPCFVAEVAGSDMSQLQLSVTFIYILRYSLANEMFWGVCILLEYLNVIDKQI